MKRLIYIFSIALVLSFYACGNKSAEYPRALDESIDLLVSNIGDSALSFEEYQPIFEEVLDSLQDVVLNIRMQNYASPHARRQQLCFRISAIPYLKTKVIAF